MFLSLLLKRLDSPCFPQDYKDEIEIGELVEFFNKRFTEFFVFNKLQNFGKRTSERSESFATSE